MEKSSWNIPTLECHWRNLVETDPHWDATRETLTFVADTGTPVEGLKQPTHAPAHMIKQSSILGSLKWQDGGTPISKWTGLCKVSLYMEFTVLQWVPILLLTHVSTSTSLCACLWYEHHYNFEYLGLQVNWNQFSSNNSHHPSCIHKEAACYEVTWLNGLQTRLSQYTGVPLDKAHWFTTGATSTLGCHWNHTGWC